MKTFSKNLVRSISVSLILVACLTYIRSFAMVVAPATGTYAPGQTVNITVTANNTTPVDQAALWLTITNGTITNFVPDVAMNGSVHAGCNGTAYFSTTQVCAYISALGEGAPMITSGTVLGVLTISTGSTGTTTLVKPTEAGYWIMLTATPDPAAPTVGVGTPTPAPEDVIFITPDAGAAASYVITVLPTNTIAVTFTASPTSTSTVTPTISVLPNTGFFGNKMNLSAMGVFLVIGGGLIMLSNKIQWKLGR